MMLMNRFARLKPGMVCIIALCVLVPTVILPATYYAQTQGVCLKAGRVLSKEELRKAVLVNVVNNTLENAFRDNWETGNDYFWVGINSPAQETDLRKLIDTSYNNGKSIEENFSLKVLLEGRNKGKYKTLTSDQLSEPFILMSYEPRSNGGVLIYISDNIQETPFMHLKAEFQEAARRETTIYKKLLGYGNHYFHFHPPSFFSFLRECCDNRNQDSKDYFKKKQEAYDSTISALPTPSEMMERARRRADSPDEPQAAVFAEMREHNPVIAVVSNCGTIWMTKGNSIHWLGNQFEDEEWP